MTTEQYSISEIRDLLCHMRNALTFLNSGIFIDYLDDEVSDKLLIFLADSVDKIQFSLSNPSE
ncbi:TPA: hypothetical protein ACX6NV_004018 [Photobacterium damselae]